MIVENNGPENLEQAVERALPDLSSHNVTGVQRSIQSEVNKLEMDLKKTQKEAATATKQIRKMEKQWQRAQKDWETCIKEIRELHQTRYQLFEEMQEQVQVFTNFDGELESRTEVQEALGDRNRASFGQVRDEGRMEYWRVAGSSRCRRIFADDRWEWWEAFAILFWIEGVGVTALEG